MFTQEHHAIERARGGLGLAIVGNPVRLRGGTARSDGAGQRSALVVCLPAAPGAPASPGDDASATSSGGTGGHDGRGRQRGAIARRLVIVDDNQDAAELLADALTARGHEVHVAHDGTSGLARVIQVAPEVALLDLGLPGMDGYELARQIRQQPGLERIWLVALTGYGDAAARQRSAAAGFDEHLVKPATLERIGQALARADRSPG